jgi:hypothetical protein
VGINYIKEPYIISKAKLMPNLEIIKLIRIPYFESDVQRRNIQNVPNAARTNEKI